MNLLIEKLLTFCDLHDLNMQILFRTNHDPDARFYVTFPTNVDLYISDGDNVFDRYGFSNGNTPEEAMLSCVADLTDKIIRIDRYSAKTTYTFLK